MSKGAKQRAAARRVVVEQRAADKRRMVRIWTSVAAVAILAVAGLIGWSVFSGQRSDTAAAATPSGAVDEGTAFAVGSGPATIDVYEDFMCPLCNQFEQQHAATLEQLASSGKATVRYHPIAILDDMSEGTRYSTRAVAAVAAAAEEGKFGQYHKVLFANQPAEGTPGLDDAKLIELGRSVGLGDTFAGKVRGEAFESWAAKVTAKASERKVTGTPTVLVNGKQVDWRQPGALASAAG